MMPLEPRAWFLGHYCGYLITPEQICGLTQLIHEDYGDWAGNDHPFIPISEVAHTFTRLEASRDR